MEDGGVHGCYAVGTAIECCLAYGTELVGKVSL